MAASIVFILPGWKRFLAYLEAVVQTAYILLNYSKQAG
jgi:hypothetical protein